MQNMKTILALVKSGRLTDATTAIQDSLGTARTGTTGPSMRDVTPMTGTLPNPAPEPVSRRAATAQKAGMEPHGGKIPFRLFRPSTPIATAPLLVMLHGCTQTPESFARGTAMNAAAERIGAHVIWPEQLRQANPNGCWNWFDPAHQGRGGEPAALVALITATAADVAPSASGLHLAGLSAGGAMAAILGTRYPELFASVGIHSGLPVGAARDVASAFAAMQSGGRDAQSLPLPAILFHGSADRTVASQNGLALARTPPGALHPRVRTSAINGRTTRVTRSDAADGSPLREYWQVDGLGHAWSGGVAAGGYADPAGPDATVEMIRFFQEVDRKS
jgi:poly(hydroxyalkanoate) depolymerase family esterase